MSFLDVLLFIGVSFFAMEWVSWLMHKFIMHGFMWRWHIEHHQPPKHRPWQKNDYFNIVFALPAMGLCLFGVLNGSAWMLGTGLGVTFYGAVYFVVHEIIIHRRWFGLSLSGAYIDRIRLAHQHHHQTPGKEGAICFGLLMPPLRYFLNDVRSLRVLKR